METRCRGLRGCRLAGLISAVTLASCGGGGGDGGSANNPPAADSSYLSAPGPTRVWLTANDLTTVRTTPNSPLHNGHFMPIAPGAATPAPFSGSLRVTSTRLETNASNPGSDAVDVVFPNVEMRQVGAAAGGMCH
jgi:hypothetical protein